MKKINLDFLENLGTVKKADPGQVRKQQIKSRKIHVSMKTVITVFCALVLLLGVVSVVTVISEKKNSAALASESDSESDAQSSGEQLLGAAYTPTAQSEASFKGCFLVGFTQTGTNGLQLLALIGADSDNPSGIKVSYIPVSKVVNADNRTADMKSHLENGGITELVWAVESAYGVSVSRYAYCDEENFVRIMKYIGQIPVTVEETVEYSYNGINFILEEGTQNFTSDMFLKYFTYLCETSEENTLKLTEMLMLFAKNLVKFEGETTPETVYDKTVNYITTDISAMDISTYMPAIYEIAKNGGFDNCSVIADPSKISE